MMHWLVDGASTAPDATSGFTWLTNYLEPLVIYNAELSQIVGDLASSWEVSDDQLTYTFHLVKETWHDGQPFSAADVAFTIGLVSDSLWALLASQLRNWLNRSPRRGRALSGASGLSMIGLGLATAATGRSR